MPSVEEEIGILVDGIKRLADPSTPDQVEFGKIVRDDRLANQLEALVQTLRAAKREKVITFEGQMLLQGAHDHVIVKILNP